MIATDDKFQPTPSPEEEFPRRVIVKFNDKAIQLPYEDNAEKYFEGEWLERWQKLAETFPGIQLNRLYISVAPSQIKELTERAIKLDPTYEPVNFLTFFAIDVPRDADPFALAEALRGWEIVEYAYVESIPAPLPVQPTGKNPDLPLRLYLDPPQVGVTQVNHIGGIDAKYTWNLEKASVGIGAGQGITFIDIEKGWNLNHQDLSGAGISLINGVSRDEQRHGTNVLGILAAQDNDFGGVGIAYRATGKVISGWKNLTDQLPNWHDAIMAANYALTSGDVLLLEAQIQPAAVFLPVELDSALFALIRQATALGFVVVESAGNGSTLLDNQLDNNGKQILNPASLDFGDSGAILVGAADPLGNQANRQVTSNFGARVDCFAWGSNVATTDTNANGTGNSTPDRADFSATSAASAIVAGAAIVVQGIAKAYQLGAPAYGGAYSPTALREILGSFDPLTNRPWRRAAPNDEPPYGTKSHVPGTDLIGVMPDLEKIIVDKMGLRPDVYLRDYLGDAGILHAGPISSSPDIILRNTQVGFYDSTYGQGSANQNRDGLGQTIVKDSSTKYIYVRVTNRGVAPAKDVRITVYWSEVATLPTPSIWFRNEIGTVNLPLILAGKMKVAEIPWTNTSASPIPPAGHYCFVGIIGNIRDPAPNPLAISTWNQYYDFVRHNNNVTWCNFNVVSMPSPRMISRPRRGPIGAGAGKVEDSDMIILPFLVTGAEFEDLPMQLEINAQLAERAQLWLEGPESFLAALSEGRAGGLEDTNEKGIKRITVISRGRDTFRNILFPKHLREQMRLIAKIPAESREQSYEVLVRQLHNDEEVGRITWRLVPPAKEEPDSLDKYLRRLKRLSPGVCFLVVSLILGLIITICICMNRRNGKNTD